MPTQNVPNMTPVPAFPALSERAAGTYNSSAYAFGTHMSATFNAELLAVANNVKYNADDAKVSADAAALSATAAASSKAEAESSASSANASKVDAAASKTAAASSAASALTSKNAAEAASSEALGHRNAAKLWADSLSGEIEPGKYSARYWAEMTANAVSGGVVYMGAWDAASGVLPPNPKRGHLYRVSTSGSVDGQSYSAGDSIIYGGASWDKIDSTDQVTTVAGRVGDVVLSKSDVGLGSVDNTSDANKPISSATQTALNGKANTTHTHAVSDVTGLQSVLDGKSNTSHSHAVADVSGLQAALDGKAAAYHGHTIADTSGLQAALDGKAAASHTHAYLPLTGGALSGAAIFTGPGNGNSVAPGNGDGCTDKVNNLKLTSWFGIGFGPSITGQPVPNGEYSHWFNVRDGSTGMRGSLTAGGNVTAFSDVRLKTDLTKIAGALGKVCSLNGYTYTRKDTGERQTGVVAQEVQKVLPEAVIDNGEHLAVAYGNMVGLLIEAIKELKAEVDQLKGK